MLRLEQSPRGETQAPRPADPLQGCILLLQLVHNNLADSFHIHTAAINQVQLACQFVYSRLQNCLAGRRQPKNGFVGFGCLDGFFDDLANKFTLPNAWKSTNDYTTMFGE